MRATFTALACSLIIGASFVIGQASAPEPAESANPNRAVLKQLKTVRADIAKVREEQRLTSVEIGKLYPNGDYSGNTPATGLRGSVQSLHTKIEKDHRLLSEVCVATQASSACY